MTLPARCRLNRPPSRSRRSRRPTVRCRPRRPAPGAADDPVCQKSIATIEPTAIAAAMKPTVAAPPPKASVATAGNRARGMARIMAQKSARNVIRTLGRVPRNRNPSNTLASPTVPRDTPAGGAQAGSGPAGAGPQRRGEQGDVHEVGQLVAAPVDQEPGQQRPDRKGHVEGEDAECVGRREEMAFEQPWVDGRTGGLTTANPALLTATNK
jgi:hypothetical protein